MKKLLVVIFFFFKNKLAITYLLFADFLILSGCGNYFINSTGDNQVIGMFCLLLGFNSEKHGRGVHCSGCVVYIEVHE